MKLERKHNKKKGPGRTANPDQKQPRQALPGKRQPNVRLMAPFGMKCTECANVIFKSTKFNARKSPTNETYLGIKIISFVIRCPQCSSQITFQTDPKTSGYIVTDGAVRIADLHRNIELENETEEQRLTRLSAEDKPVDKIEQLETNAEENLKQAQRDKEVFDLQRLVEARRKLTQSRGI